MLSERAGDSAAQRSAWRFEGAGRRSECGQGGLAGDSECQSDLRRARRSGFCRRRSTRPRSWRIWARITTRRGRGALAYSRRALSGVVVGCARLRRNGFDCAADDRSAVWRQDGARCFPDAARRADAERVRRRCARRGSRRIKGDFETGWRKALHDGWIADTAYAKTADAAKRGDSAARFPRRRRRIRWKLFSGPIRISMTGAGRMWAGCRSCPSR